jgi:hypothetical protein
MMLIFIEKANLQEFKKPMFCTVDGFFPASNEEWTSKIYAARAYPLKKVYKNRAYIRKKIKKNLKQISEILQHWTETEKRKQTGNVGHFILDNSEGVIRPV